MCVGDARAFTQHSTRTHIHTPTHNHTQHTHFPHASRHTPTLMHIHAHLLDTYANDTHTHTVGFCPKQEIDELVDDWVPDPLVQPTLQFR